MVEWIDLYETRKSCYAHKFKTTGKQSKGHIRNKRHSKDNHKLLNKFLSGSHPNSTACYKHFEQNRSLKSKEWTFYINDYKREFEGKTSEGKTLYEINIPKILKFRKSPKINHGSEQKIEESKDQSRCTIL